LTDSDKAASGESDVASEPKSRNFTLAEMITCDACLRANPPTRAACFYCGAGLPVTSNQEEPHPAGEASGSTAGLAANGSNGYYIVLAPNQTNIPSASSLSEIASLLHLKAPEVQSVLDGGWPVPVARAATTEQAAQLIENLQALGIEADPFKDDGLGLDTPARKIRALEMSDGGFVSVLLSDGGRVSTLWDDLVLIIAGRLLVSRVEVEERRRRGRAQPMGSRELFSDESVLDLYTKSTDSGWRISSSSFDFSCLGSEKAMTAFENFSALLNLLRLRAPNVEVDVAYVGLRPVLANVWPLEPQTRKGEWRRNGAGKYDVATVTTTDNEAQFNRYSRLRHGLKLRGLEGRE
jgi:hypothetical protein